MQIVIADEVVNLRVAAVEATGLTLGPADAPLRAYCREVVQQVQQQGMAGGERRREAVRKLLRFGGFKPSGRSKPAQEYLQRTAREENALPVINNAVDLINAVSLASGLPISLLARERLSDAVLLRYGRAGESFLFNRAGQQLDLTGLLCTCRAQDDVSEPLGSPVKDSMLGKVEDHDRDLLAVIYAPQDAVDTSELETYARRLAEGFQSDCRASEARWFILSSARGPQA